MIEIVDNHSRKTWIIPIKQRKDVPAVLSHWKESTEFHTDARLKSIRSDGAPELVAMLEDWVQQYKIRMENTVPYMSSQNGVAERGIQTSEDSIRAMLQEAELPVCF